MSAAIIDGRVHAARILERVKASATRLCGEHGIVPGLAVVLVGEDPASQVYVRNKVRQTEMAGMRSIEHRLPAETSEAELIDLVTRLNADEAVDGILVQLPLPPQIRQQAVIEAIDPAKDVDGLNPVNAGRLASGMEAMAPCTPLGCMRLVRAAVGGPLDGLEAVVVGRSNLVGRPLAQLLLAHNCTVTIAHSRTRDLPCVCRRADILIVAAGRPAMVGAAHVKPGAIVIDVGINRVPAPEKGEGGTRLVGDVDFEAAEKVAGAITPVPGGVGPMTVALLMANTLTAACARRRLPAPEI